jgi:hypothetical protein
MMPDRWKQISSVFAAVRSRPDEERAAYLEQACGTDTSLRRDVEALLANGSSPSAVLQEITAPTESAFDAPRLTGKRFGAYQVQDRLGAGGMGEVYRARDTRLGRDVAIKIVAHRFTSDPERLARFEREARTLAALNHPNIGAIYGFEEAEGIRGLVLELVDGDLLRDRIARGRIPLRDALLIARQITDALETAHDKGFVHRDLKPGNIAFTRDGTLKLLDFGLAKAITGESGVGNRLEPNAMTAGETRAGAIVGTANYMSPEQAKGQPVDKRADIWAFGCVLHEMLTGKLAFPGETMPETFVAVLERQPDWTALPADTPPNIRRLLERCLVKDPKRRLRDIGDARMELDDALTRDDSRASNAGRGSRWERRWPAIAIVAAAMLVAGIGLATFISQPPAAPSFDQLTFRRARIGGARFASGGAAVVYSEASQGPTLQISRLDLADGPGGWQVLNYPAGSDLLAARAGELALSLDRRFVLGERFVGTLALAPLGGGAPRPVAENVEDADWAPQAQLAIVRSSGGVLGQSAIEFPMGTVLHKTSGSIRFLRASRDGQRFAFVEEALGRGASGYVAVVDVSGNVTRLTGEWDTVRGLAWSATGDEIWFTAGSARANRALRAVTLDRKERVVLTAPGSLTLWDIASDGRVLLSRDEERWAVVGVAPGENVERDLSWFDDSGLADISDNGLMVLCGDRSGVYVRPIDGSPPTHLLNDGFGDDLSPDGKRVLATVESGRTLMLVPTGAGSVTPLPKPQELEVYRGAKWFPDGKHIMFTGSEAGKDSRTYVQDTSGGLPKPVTPEGTRALAISFEGDSMAVVAPGKEISIMPIDGGATQSIPGTDSNDRPVAWSADRKSLWVFRRGEVPAPVYLVDIATGKRTLWKLLSPLDATGVYTIGEFRITPTAHAYAYSYTRLVSQLYLVRGLN